MSGPVAWGFRAPWNRRLLARLCAPTSPAGSRIRFSPASSRRRLPIHSWFSEGGRMPNAITIELWKA
jgi:hypothetical protein